MDTIAILSILEGKPYKEVKKLWRLFEKKYNSVGVQRFNHPDLCFQAGVTDNLKLLRKNLPDIVEKIKPFDVKVNGFGHFDKKVIYLKVEKTNRLVKINRPINQFLKEYCNEVFEYYTAENWIPHLTVAMKDLTEENFEKAWSELKDAPITFKQTVHNICLVKWYPGRKVRILKKYEL